MKFQLVSSKSRIFLRTSSPSTGWKFSFLVLSELAVNATCPSITVTKVLPRRTLLLALTMAFAPDSRSIEQIPSRHIGKGPDCTIVVPRGVAKQRLESDRAVAYPRGVAKQCVETVGSVLDGI